MLSKKIITVMEKRYKVRALSQGARVRAEARWKAVLGWDGLQEGQALVLGWGWGEPRSQNDKLVFLQFALCHVCVLQRVFRTGPGLCARRLSAGCVFGTGCL